MALATAAAAGMVPVGLAASASCGASVPARRTSGRALPGTAGSAWLADGASAGQVSKAGVADVSCRAASATASSSERADGAACARGSDSLSCPTVTRVTASSPVVPSTSTSATHADQVCPAS
ncbi:hypothetical protein D3C72_1969580 [compost metagenome]